MRTVLAPLALTTLLIGGYAWYGRADAATTAPSGPKTCPIGQTLYCYDKPGACVTPWWGTKADCVIEPPKTVCYCASW